MVDLKMFAFMLLSWLSWWFRSQTLVFILVYFVRAEMVKLPLNLIVQALSQVDSTTVGQNACRYLMDVRHRWQYAV